MWKSHSMQREASSGTSGKKRQEFSWKGVLTNKLTRDYYHGSTSLHKHRVGVKMQTASFLEAGGIFPGVICLVTNHLLGASDTNEDNHEIMNTN